jgi:hypothetical protein
MVCVGQGRERSEPAVAVNHLLPLFGELRFVAQRGRDVVQVCSGRPTADYDHLNLDHGFRDTVSCISTGRDLSQCCRTWWRASEWLVGYLGCSGPCWRVGVIRRSAGLAVKLHHPRLWTHGTVRSWSRRQVIPKMRIMYCIYPRRIATLIAPSVVHAVQIVTRRTCCARRCSIM